MPQPSRLRSLCAAALALGLGLANALGFDAASGAARAAELNPLEVANAMSEAYADLFEQIAPSVVSVKTIHTPPALAAADPEAPEAAPGQRPRRRNLPFNRPGQPDENDGADEGESEGEGDNEANVPENRFFGPNDMFRRFFGDDIPPGFNFGPRGMERGPSIPRRYESQGSGVIIDDEGHILTNSHVVERADEIEISMMDGTIAEAEVVARDPETDIAVIRLKGYNGPLHPAKLGDSDRIRTGNIVIAIGSPFGRLHSVTSGIVSGKDRSLRAITYERYLQTDAAINPGNSGGPLVNLAGEVVGINTIINTRSGGSEGVGFAVPSNLAKTIASQLIEKGRVTRGWLGIAMTDVTPAMKKALPGVASGALVQTVYPDGPAAQGGMERGDVIVSVDGRAIPSSRDLQERIADIAPNAKVVIGVIRAGEAVDIEVTLAERTEEVLAATQRQNGRERPRAQGRGDQSPSVFKADKLGLRLREMNERERGLFGEESGLIVTWVDPNGPAAEGGVRRDMLIIQIDQKTVTTLDEAREAVEGVGDKEYVQTLVMPRGGVPSFIAIKAVKDKPEEKK